MPKKVSLVLSGGGARGLAHIGVIEEIEKRGYEIHSVVGTSMGALVGGVYAMGKMEEFKNWMYTLDRRKVFNLVDFTLSTHGMIKGDKVLNRMKEFISDKPIEDFPIYFAALAVNLIKKEEVVFTEGSIYDAIRASISIPNVLTPVKTEDGFLVDGGLMNNLPMSYAKRVDGDILVAVDVGANVPVIKPMLTKKETKEKENAYQKRMKDFYQQLHKLVPSRKEELKEEKLGYFDLMSKTVDLMMEQQTKLNLMHHHPDILVEISRESAGTYDFYKAEELVEIGRMAFLQTIKKD
ncbi:MULTISPECIES: patatin-like phospholipase family protein [unclassified Lentimicrobium]|uniref:patatin-like phospholipase family protein n=1 Tax=unclassified Lentimicrobium TaxID=2677434 RepID=UPI001556CCA3|nr:MULTISPECIES: patatin-like phospholipase family protein [unclassified Lentimicrobium]NPD47249.1 phospholipase [Lentimicrobium sp. S6]NPD86768.1 phospholipase [Lentimicrobium sp. L6]